jgi:hypothetical protein
MDKTRSTFGYKREHGGGEIIFFGISYGWVVGARSNHNIVFKFSSFCNVQSLKVLSIGISCAFMLVLYLCERGSFIVNVTFCIVKDI